MLATNNVVQVGWALAKLGRQVSDDGAATTREIVDDERSTGGQVGQPGSKRRIDADAHPHARIDGRTD